MKEYDVFFEKTYTLMVRVFAEDKDEAKEFAIQAIDAQPREILLEQSQEGYWEQTDIDEVV